MNDRDLAPRHVLITGASSGIGAETARYLVADGHRVSLFARRTEPLSALVRELGGLASAWSGDVTCREDLDRALRSADERHGAIDTLVYSAGSARFHPVEETSFEEWRELMGANLDGLFHALQLSLPFLLASGRGQVIVVLSVAARQVFGNSAGYTAAKPAAIGLVDSFRAEVRARGVHVTSILPGAVDTPLWDAIGGEWNRAQMMQPEQVARVIRSVLRDRSSGMLEEIRVGPIGGAL